MSVIRRISSIRQYMTVEATKTLVCAYVPSKLNCNFLLSGNHFTFSDDCRKCKCLQQNRFPNHTDVITCNHFFKLFIGYRSKPE